MKTANVIHVIGEVVEVTDEIASENGKPFRFIFAVDAKGVRHQIVTSSGQLDKFRIGGQSYSAALSNGFMANLECEERIEGVTEYEDESGSVKAHGNTGLALRAVLPLASFQKKVVEKEAFAEFSDSLIDKRVAKLRALGLDDKDIAVAIQNL